MPRTADHAASAEKWLAQAEHLEPTEPTTMALIAQAHALLAVASHLGAARVRPGARALLPDAWLRADEAAIDRVRAASATEEQRGMRGVTPSMVIVDEVDLGDEPGWHRAETHYFGDGHEHLPQELPDPNAPEEDG